MASVRVQIREICISRVHVEMREICMGRVHVEIREICMDCNDLSLSKLGSSGITFAFGKNS